LDIGLHTKRQRQGRKRFDPLSLPTSAMSTTMDHAYHVLHPPLIGGQIMVLCAMHCLKFHLEQKTSPPNRKDGIQKWVDEYRRQQTEGWKPLVLHLNPDIHSDDDDEDDKDTTTKKTKNKQHS
jgi:hypothetical protein